MLKFVLFVGSFFVVLSVRWRGQWLEVYKIVYISVVSNDGKYRASNHEFKVLFNGRTRVVEEVAEIIPRSGLFICVVSLFFNPVMDPTYHEESVITGCMTATLNSNGDVCSIQKVGGQGVLHKLIMHCLRLAHVKAGYRGFSLLYTERLSFFASFKLSFLDVLCIRISYSISCTSFSLMILFYFLAHRF